jgi:hypothetical protein
VTHDLGNNWTHSEAPSVVKINGLYYMAFQRDYNARFTWLAMSRDGYAWTLVKPLHESINGDRIFDGSGDTGGERPSWLLDGSRAYLFFASPSNAVDGHWRIGVETADF